MEHVKIFNATPIAASRPKVTKRGTYYAEPYNTFKQNFALWAKMNYKTILEGALGVNIYFYMPIPKSLSKKKYEEIKGAYHIKRPDVDNLVKAVLDGLNGFAYKDDSQVAQLSVTKRYSETPRIEISIKELTLSENV